MKTNGVRVQAWAAACVGGEREPMAALPNASVASSLYQGIIALHYITKWPLFVCTHLRPTEASIRLIAFRLLCTVALCNQLHDMSTVLYVITIKKMGPPRAPASSPIALHKSKSVLGVLLQSLCDTMNNAWRYMAFLLWHVFQHKPCNASQIVSQCYNCVMCRQTDSALSNCGTITS